ncbi:hypothetical protein HPB50_017359 [Hyalomma asiaticum]|uniref:Uncharacterized protein n=1 Tax=Hyalomma asiaticum TaxID=266040 RepID=A0ACB7RQ63_HYAAI|nr:hypothetical protein HPB50_017359 [Hyalomma asiaticum]
MSSGTYQRITFVNVGPPRHVEPSESSNPDMERLALDCLFVRRFRRLAGIVLSNVAAVLVMVVLLVLSVAYEVIVYQVGLTTSQFYVVLGKKQWWGFLNQTAFCLGLIALVACVKSAKQYVSSTVTVQWRQLLTKRLQELYFSRKVHYRVNVVETSIDNPDQRITQDVDRLCQVLSDIVPTLLISPFTIAYYSYQSFSVAGYIGPLAVFVYFVISTAVSKLLITRVVPRVYELERQEGRFRYKHAQIRANSDKLVDLSSGISTVAGNTHRISVLLERMEAINEEESILEKMKQAKKSSEDDDSDASDEVLPQFILKDVSYGSPYDDNIFAEGLTLELSPPRSVFVTGPSNSGKTSLLRILKGLWSPLLGTVVREFRGSLFLPQVTWFGSGSLRSQLYYPYTPPKTTPHEEGEIWSPYDDNIFAEALTLELSPPRSVFVTGPSNSGKTSLLRILKGLWSPLLGSVVREFRGSLFLPQVTWFGSGSLRSQLYYPYTPPKTTPHEEGEIWRLIELADLGHLLKRSGGLDSSLQPMWYESLSPGERQRLSFLRVLCQRPKMALLDEATSALDEGTQVKLYRECHKLGIATVTIGHHACLEPLHDATLELHGAAKGGTWTLKEREKTTHGDSAVVENSHS